LKTFARLDHEAGARLPSGPNRAFWPLRFGGWEKASGGPFVAKKRTSGEGNAS